LDIHSLDQDFQIWIVKKIQSKDPDKLGWPDDSEGSCPTTYTH